MLISLVPSCLILSLKCYVLMCYVKMIDEDNCSLKFVLRAHSFQIKIMSKDTTSKVQNFQILRSLSPPKNKTRKSSCVNARVIPPAA